MNRCRLLPLATILIFAVTAHAQQARTSAGEPTKSVSGGEYAGVPTVETQLKVLTEKLELTADQRDKIKSILKDLHDATEKVMQDASLSREERLAKVRRERYKADERIRADLNEEQKKRLDEYERGPHSEMHGTLSGATTPPSPSN
jgi:Spy/CpxP family protein refolding chaperone